MTVAPPLIVEDLTKHFPLRGGLLNRVRSQLHAVDDVSLTLARGETLGLVGESGCGKSTLGRCILRLENPNSGRITLEGVDVTSLSRSEMRPYRQKLQAVFQDPYSSLNSRMRAGEIVAEPLQNFGISTTEAKIAELFEKVGLHPERAHHFPHEFSGGQRQRLAIAKALALNPSVIVCDEAVSALDVSVQAQIVNLLQDLQVENGLSLLFITHDLAIVEHVSHRVAVMYLGEIVEIAPKARIFSQPLHPYTRALLDAIPSPDPGRTRRPVLRGDVPSPINIPPGCRFASRCSLAVDECRKRAPPLRQVAPGHSVACHLAEGTLQQ